MTIDSTSRTLIQYDDNINNVQEDDGNDNNSAINYDNINSNNSSSTSINTMETMETILSTFTSSTSRLLVTLRMPSDRNETKDETISMRDWFLYTPSSTVSTMHATPRFGHSNRVGLLASSHPNAPMDYAQGIKQFSLFYLVVPLILWVVLLFTFKYVYGLRRVGCAAGGEVLDMYVLSKPPYSLSRKQRQKRVYRSWRLQSAFLLASVLIPVVSIVMMSIGLSTMITSIDELQNWVQDVDALAFRGWTAVRGMKTLQDKLIQNGKSDNPLIQGMLDYENNNNTAATAEDPLDTFLQKHRQQPNPEDDPLLTILSSQQQQPQQQQGNKITQTATSVSGFFFETWCPGAAQYANQLDFFVDAVATVDLNTKSILQEFQPIQTSAALSQTSNYFQVITETTLHIDSALSWFLNNDWLLKLLVLVLNVVNLFLLLNVQLLSKNNIIHHPTRTYVTYILMPIFGVVTLLTTIVTLLFGIAAQVNSDFCAGGPRPGSIQGTLQDAILSILQYGNLNRESYRPINGSISTLQEASQVSPLDLAYAAIDYFSTGCLSDNPLSFLNTISSDLESAVAHVNQLSTILAPDDNQTIATLNEVCDRDLSFLAPALHDLNQLLGNLRTHVQQLADCASCHRISPLFRRLSHGAMCVEMPQSLTVLWSCCFVLCILCMVMLTTRAALYNSVKRKKARNKKPRRVVEKEFSDYQEFMGQYYEDTQHWNLDEPLPQYDKPIVQKATKICLEFDDNYLETKPTFDTAPSSTPTSEELGDIDGTITNWRASATARLDEASDVGGFHRYDRKSVDVSRLWEDDSYGSEYDSEISDDDSNKDGEASIDDDEESAMMSFISETKSIAMQTLHSLQKIKPLLASINPMLASRHDRSDEEEDDNRDDDFLFQNKDIGRAPTKQALELDPSVCEDSLYFGTQSMFDPPSTPGLHPKSTGGHSRNAENANYDERSDDSFGYANPYVRKTQVQSKMRQDGLLHENIVKNGWFGRSAKHRSDKLSTVKSITASIGGKSSHSKRHTPVETFEGPRMFQILTPSSIISTLTPSAPNKPFSFLYRTKDDKEVFHDLYCDDDNDAGDGVFVGNKDGSVSSIDDSIVGIQPPTTPRRDSSSVFSLSPAVASIRPTKLELSPLLTPVQQKRRSSNRSRSRSRPRSFVVSEGPSNRSRSQSRPRSLVVSETTSPKHGNSVVRSSIRSRKQRSGSMDPPNIPSSTTVQGLVVAQQERPKKEVKSVRRKSSQWSSSSYPRNDWN
ncbi:hypothetical protein IV203_012788 [Nitzschia inconspicua]|uniref:Uncharacterized protein n=1 Tax=Nitzschia inconspicua TaxID=303405 RepID=A0A9K3KU94_9STRA|nr:hypothetical protein IV203_012762 [Nitzschia inconspicua]KAG7350045.1 hypothetical protein IV203_012642 [Nitzschia inconspicua]KAG7373693.1 hypothetical protein IV203_012788 [Nitzschia inconspicua]